MHLTSSYRAAVAISEIIYRILAPKPSTMARIDIGDSDIDHKLRERYAPRAFYVAVTAPTNLPVVVLTLVLKAGPLGQGHWNSAEIEAETLTHPNQKFRFTAEFVEGEWKVEPVTPSVCPVQVRGTNAVEAQSV